MEIWLTSLSLLAAYSSIGPLPCSLPSARMVFKISFLQLVKEDIFMSSFGPMDATQYLKRTFPRFRIILTYQKEKILFTRFASLKIVQNMIKNKMKLQLTLISPELKVLQKSVNEWPEEEGLKFIVQEMIGQMTNTQALDYCPSPITAQGYWGEGAFAGDLPVEPMVHMVGELLKEGEQRKLDNLAGFVQNERTLKHLTSTDGANLIQETSTYQMDLSCFRQQYEITSSCFEKSWEKLKHKDAIAPMETWLNLPTGNLSLGSHRVILSSKAMASLLAYALYTNNFNVMSLREGTSPLTALIGKPWLHSSIQVSDHPDPAKIIFYPFDSLGHLRQWHPLIQEGKFMQGLYNEREAQLANFPYFGHCQGLRETSAYPLDLEMKGSNKDLNQLWSEMGDGYYIHNLHYLSVSDPQKMTLFGLTRGGLLKIQGGRPVQKVQNMRVELSLPELLSQVENIGISEECKGWMGSITAPSLLVKKGINFTEAATNI